MLILGDLACPNEEYSNKLITDILNVDPAYVKRTLLNIKKGN